jgi:hypothetical protein
MADLTKFHVVVHVVVVLQLRLPARTLLTAFEQRLQALSDVCRDALCCRLVVFPFAPDLSEAILSGRQRLSRGRHTRSGLLVRSTRQK